VEYYTGSAFGEAFTALESTIQWYEQKPDCKSTVFLLLKIIKDLITKKKAHWKCKHKCIIILNKNENVCMIILYFVYYILKLIELLTFNNTYIQYTNINFILIDVIQRVHWFFNFIFKHYLIIRVTIRADNRCSTVFYRQQKKNIILFNKL